MTGAEYLNGSLLRDLWVYWFDSGVLHAAAGGFDQPLPAEWDGVLLEQATRRFYLLLLGALGALALAVATVGIYGVMAYSVTRRIREVGIRIVLGARWPQILLLFGRRTMLLVAIGVGTGLTGAAWLTRYIENLLFGIEPTDPVAFAATAALLASAALMATLVPMRRALRVDPAATLRAE
jgi:putative ABC transport system permease protein